MRAGSCALMVLALAAAPVFAAVDCGRPKSTTERLLCSNDRVSEANEQMAFAFLNAYRRANTDELRATMRTEQRTWETQVRDACSDVPCLLRVYYDRTLELDQY